MIYALSRYIIFLSFKNVFDSRVWLQIDTEHPQIGPSKLGLNGSTLFMSLCTVNYVCVNRPVRTNLELVRRVRGKNLLSMKAERAKRAERLTAWVPGARSRAPGGVQGQSPGGGPGSSAPGSSWVLAFVKGPERLSWKYSFSLNQPTSVVQKCFN